VEWNFLGPTELTLPRFLVDDFNFDDPFHNSLISAAAADDEVALDLYIQDIEGNTMTFTYDAMLPSWLVVSSSGTSIGNVLTDNRSRSALPFLGLGTLVTVGLVITDSGASVGSSLNTSFDILNYRLDFDVSTAQNNAEGTLNGAGTTTTITSNYFGGSPANNPANPGLGSASTINLLNAPDVELDIIAEFMDWQINGSNQYQIGVTDTLGGAGTASVAFQDIPIATSEVQVLNLRVGVTQVVAGSSAYTIGLASDNGDIIIGDLVNKPDIIYGFDGNDDIFGDTEANLSAVGNIGGNQLIFGGDGDDNLAGDFYGSLTTLDDDLFSIENGQRGGNDIIYGGEGDDWIAGDSFYEGTIAIQAGGEAGSDVIYGGNGMNVIWGDTLGGISGIAGNDWIEGGDDSDIIYGDTEGDINGVAGNDFLSGGAGDDEIYSDTSGSTIAIKGVDTIVGGPGDDTLYGAGFASNYTLGGIFPFVSNVFRYNLTIDNGADTIERMISSVSGPMSVARAIIEFTNASGTTLDTLAEVLDFSIRTMDAGTFYVAAIKDAGTDSTILFALSSFLPTNNPVVLPIRLTDTSGVEVIYNTAILDGTANGTVGDPYVLATQTFPNDAAYLFQGDDYAVGDDPTGTTFGAQLISGGDGNDTIFGDTNGTLDSAAGEDYINGGGGNDNLYGDGSAFGPSAVRANNTFAYSLASDNGTDTIFDFNFRNDVPAGEDTILITDAIGSSVHNLADIIEFPSNFLILNDTADGGAGSTKGTIVFVGPGIGIKEYSFAIQDIFGSEESYNVIVGNDDEFLDDTLFDSVTLDNDIFVGLLGDDTFEFIYEDVPVSLGTNVILDFNTIDDDIVLNFLVPPSPLIADYTEVIDSGVDLNDDGLNDIQVLVTIPSDGTGVGDFIFSGINYVDGDNALTDYGITASIVTA
jgi:hypothetical protein